MAGFSYFEPLNSRKQTHIDAAKKFKRGAMMGGPPPQNFYDGTPTNRTLPEWMDPTGQCGELCFLLMKGVDDAPLPKNPFTVGKSVEQTVGKIAGASLEGGGVRYILKVRNLQQIDKLLTLKNLIDGTRVVVQMHPTLNQRKFIVFCPEALELTEAEILEGLKDQKVIAVHRITKKGQDKVTNTPLLVITMSGTVVPNYINFGLLKVRTRVYYSNPMQCYNCFDYGHTTKKCQRDKACRNCSSVHEEEDAICAKHAFCLHCKSDHSPLDRKCPRREVEVEIIRTKTDLGLTFAEARKLVEEKHKNQVSSKTMAGRLSQRLEEIRKIDSKPSNSNTETAHPSSPPTINNNDKTNNNECNSQPQTITNVNRNQNTTANKNSAPIITTKAANNTITPTPTVKSKRKNRQQNQSPASDDNKPIKKVPKKTSIVSSKKGEPQNDIEITSD